MTAKVLQMVNSRESEQTTRFRWYEGGSAFYVWDSHAIGKPFMRCMGDGVDMFGPVDGDDSVEGLPLVPGTQRFYDTLNAYFENEQEEIGRTYFDVEI